MVQVSDVRFPWDRNGFGDEFLLGPTTEAYGPVSLLFAGWAGVLLRYTGHAALDLPIAVRRESTWSGGAIPFTKAALAAQLMGAFDALMSAEWAGISRAVENRPALSFVVVDELPFPTEQHAPYADLSVIVASSNGCARWSIRYNAAQCSERLVRQIRGHVRAFCAAIRLNPESPLDSIEFLNGAERAELLGGCKRPGTIEQCAMHDLFHRQVERTPDAISVISGAESVTYKELHLRSSVLAKHLITQGVHTGVVVGVALERSIDLAVSLLAVLKAGGICMPLDPSYPVERLQLMIGDAAPVLTITAPGILPAALPHLRCVDPNPAAVDESVVLPHVQADQIAYLLYTSGSTGAPRGVMLPHRGLANHNIACARMFALGPKDRVVQLSSLSFDVAIEEMYPAWSSGAAVVFRPKGLSLAGLEFLQWLETQEITVIDSPTALWHDLVSFLAETGETLPECLRLLVVGGEKASASALRKWQSVARPGLRWINTYGPTEASVIATAWEAGTLAECEEIPIGRPIDNVRTYVLDAMCRPVPVGVSGELFIAGVSVAQGYLNRPDVTSQKFLEDPFALGERMYRTGDLAAWRSDGTLEFRGRTDDQVKIRGFRVEPGEVESVMTACEAVREGAVVAVTGRDERKRLVGFYVEVAGTTMTARDLRSWMLRRVPDYMVPSEFVKLSILPLSANGKLNRKRLGAIYEELCPESEAITQQDTLAVRLASIWSAVLGVRHVQSDDNFFELGGDSLSAMRMVSRVEKELDKKIGFTVLLRAPTLDAFTAEIQRGHRSSAGSSLYALQPSGSKPKFFCVHGMGGAVLRFRNLAIAMAPDHPFYALQAPGVDDGRECPQNVSDFAAQYIEEIRTVQAHGPYFLGGYSFGGLVALEMAHQLNDAGEEVALLALIDTFVLERDSKPEMLQNFARLPLRAQVSYLSQKAYKKTKRTLKNVKLTPSLREVRRRCVIAERDYKPRFWDGRVVLFRAAVGSLRGERGIRAWEAFANCLAVRQIPGDHGDILRSAGSEHLARELKRCIDLDHKASDHTAAIFDARSTHETDVPAPGRRSENSRSRAGWIRSGVLAVIDQGLTSGSNFACSMLLARWMSADQYGAFALAFALFLLLATVYQCVVLEPMSVFGGSRYAGALRGYLRSLTSLHTVATGIVAGAVGLLALASWIVVPNTPSTGAFIGLSIAAPLILLLWLARRALYFLPSPAQAASASLIYSVLLLSSLTLCWRFGRLTPLAALIVMGAASGTVGAVSLARLRSTLAKEGRGPSAGEALHQHWQYGKWALAGSVAGWIPAYIYFPLLANFASLARTAELKAVMNFAAPLMQLQAAFSLLLLPWAAGTIRDGGARVVRSLARRLTAAAVAIGCVYWAALIACGHWVFATLYLGKYPEAQHLLPLAAVGSILWTATFGCTLLLRAMNRPNLTFTATAVATGLSMLIGIPAALHFGVSGALAGIGISDGLALILMVWNTGHALRRDAIDERDIADKSAIADKSMEMSGKALPT